MLQLIISLKKEHMGLKHMSICTYRAGIGSGGGSKSVAFSGKKFSCSVWPCSNSYRMLYTPPSPLPSMGYCPACCLTGGSGHGSQERWQYFRILYSLLLVRATSERPVPSCSLFLYAWLGRPPRLRRRVWRGDVQQDLHRRGVLLQQRPLRTAALEVGVTSSQPEFILCGRCVTTVVRCRNSAIFTNMLVCKLVPLPLLFPVYTVI